MEVVTAIALIVAGILAASAFIVAQAPDAKRLIDKLVPVQGVLGVGLLVVGVVRLIQLIPKLDDLSAIGKVHAFYPIAVWIGIACAILLGILLGIPLIAKMMPGESAVEQKAVELQKKIVPYQTLLGLVSVGIAVVLLYYYFKLH